MIESPVNYNVEKSKYTIAPDSTLKILWDLLGMVFITYQGIVIPFRLCYNYAAYGGWAVFELIQDFYFYLDILLTANSGFYLKGILIMTRKNIIINYLKKWFWLDVIASFPYSVIVTPHTYFDIYNTYEDLSINNSISLSAPQILRMLKFMRFMRFLRLIRVIKLKKIIDRVSKINLILFFNF